MTRKQALLRIEAALRSEHDDERRQLLRDLYDSVAECEDDKAVQATLRRAPIRL